MKRHILPLLMAVIAMLPSCNPSDHFGPSEDFSEEEMPQKVSLQIQLTQPGQSLTRSTADNWKESEVKALYVYVFNSDGSIDAAGQAENLTSLTLKCETGEGKKIYALANITPPVQIEKEADLKDFTSKLTDNKAQGVVLSGHIPSLNLGKNQTVPIEMYRSIAKITVDKITVKTTDLYLKDKDFIIKKIYLVNAAGGKYPCFQLDDRAIVATYKPDIWYNKMKYEANAASDLYLYDAVNATVKNNASHSTKHVFYAYPNFTGTDQNDGIWKDRMTRLVVEMEIDNKTYYYTKTFESIHKNTHYHISNLTITRKGSPSPDQPVSDQAATFELDIVPWTTSEVGDVTI